LDSALHLTAGRFLAAIAVSCPHFVGLYLFREGAVDFKKGCFEMNNHMHPVCARMEFLTFFMPICCVLRIFFAPALWFNMAEHADFDSAFHSLPVLLWIVCWSVPFTLLNQILLMPGMRHMFSSWNTLTLWPETIRLNRPYHGLTSTRCHAANGGFYAELLWNLWIVFQGTDVQWRLGGITVPLVIFNVGMLAGGPLNFLIRSPKKDRWIGETYLVTSGIATGVLAVSSMFVLNHAWFGIRSTVDLHLHEGPLGPFGHWSVLLWNVLLLVQILVSRSAVTSAEELRPGPPWICGGADHKEFYFPRFWGLLYFCYGMAVSFNLWIMGNYLWMESTPLVAEA